MRTDVIIVKIDRIPDFDEKLYNKVLRLAKRFKVYDVKCTIDCSKVIKDSVFSLSRPSDLDYVYSIGFLVSYFDESDKKEFISKCLITIRNEDY